MKAHDTKYVDQGRAAALLGIPEKDLCQISYEAGLGHKESRGAEEETYFTYEELRKICQLTVHRVH